MQNINKIKEYQKELKEKNPEQVLEWIINEIDFKKITFASSFGAEDQVLTDMIFKIDKDIEIFTIDTGRLHQETYDVMQETMQRYNLKIKVLFPQYKDVEKMEEKFGPNLFYKSIQNRKKCCYIRKVKSLERQLKNLDAWICGLRKEQSVTRENIQIINWDEKFKLIKINPLAEWSEKEVWNYLRKNKVPYNKLHDNGYPSIGCVPCTRSVEVGNNIRSGRWWWEDRDFKECGLH